MNNNPKRHFHIDSDASTDQALKLLDAVQSDNEDEINELMNDFDTKLIAPEEIELTDNPENVRLEFDIEANVHVVEKGTTHTRELERNKRKKKPKESTPITWEHKVFDESDSAFDIYEQIINLNVLIEILAQQKRSLFATKREKVSHQCLEN